MYQLTSPRIEDAPRRRLRRGLHAPLHVLLGHVSEVALLVDPEATILYANEAVDHVLGRSAEQLVGTSVFDLVHSEDADQCREALTRTGGRQRREVRLRALHADGTCRWLQISIDDLVDDPAVEAIAVTAKDVTERPTEHFQGIVDHAADGIVSVDANRRIVMFNHAAVEIFGYDAADVLGHPLDVLLPERVRGAHRQLVDGFAMLPGTARRMNPDRSELTGRRADGTEFPAEITISKIDHDGEVTLTAIVRDVTTWRELESELAFRATRRRAYPVGEPGALQSARRARTRGATCSKLPLAVLYIDLDRFKAVNDTHGHLAGDELLRVVAARFEHFFRAGDVVARFGGDEFAVLCEPAGSEHDMVSRGSALITQLCEPVTLAYGGCASVSASVGISFASPDSTIETMLRDADVALYRAKHGGRGRAVVFGMGRRLRPDTA